MQTQTQTQTQTGGLRQQPGFACEECRRRKARCDRVRPECGFCSENGTPCIIIEKRPQRGPKKGQLNMMRTRIAMLECQLGKQLGYADANPAPTDVGVTVTPTAISGPVISDLEHNPHTNTNLDFDYQLAQMAGLTETGMTGVSVTSSAGSETAASLSVSTERPDRDNSLMSPNLMSMPLDYFGNSSPTLAIGDMEISDLMRADLDQLYFERVHAVGPMIHKRRYFSWAGRENPTPSQLCLRSAMHAIAAAMSAQYRGVGHTLYLETRRLLETHSQAQTPESPWLMPKASDRILLEQVQTWLLVALYESLRMDEQQAMLTAGRAFRLVQMARLYDVDALDDAVTSELEPDETFAETEEKRRTFWFAFSFDRFLSWRSEWPLTLQEEMVSTRLPAPESNFENSQAIRVGFLSEVMAEDGPSTLSPFAECVVLATLHGRCMAHRRASTKEGGKEPRGFWVRHEWLAAAVDKRVKLLTENQTSTRAVEGDPLLFFTRMLAHSMVLYLSCTMKRTPWHSVEHQLMSSNYEQRASLAVAEMVRLVESVPPSCFKAHPFLSNPVAAAAAFLLGHGGLEKGRDSLESLLRVLRNLGEINNLARDLLSMGMTILCDQGADMGLAGYLQNA